MAAWGATDKPRMLPSVTGLMPGPHCSSGQEVWAGGQLFMKKSTLCIWPDLLAASHCSTGQEAVRMLLC